MGPADWKKVMKQRREKKRAALKKRRSSDSATVRNGSRRSVTKRSPRKGCGCKRKK